MGWLETVDDIAERYQTGKDEGSNDTASHEEFQRVAQSAPRDALTNGIAGMFRSNETPPFAEMVSGMFAQSNPDQKTGLLNHLLSAVPPAALAGIPALGGNLLGSHRDTADAANQLSPDQVRQIATHAEAKDPGIIEKVSSFYAQHPGVMKAVGGMALAVAMKHMRKGV